MNQKEMQIRKATAEDIPAIAEIYEEIHDEEEAGRVTSGWIRGVYPTKATAEAAVAAGECFVLELAGKVVACGRINQVQQPEYYKVNWLHAATDEQVMVLHTLVVSPGAAGRGCGKGFAAFYEDYARQHGCTCLRIDTNERNVKARRLYQGLGYREAGTVPCVFNGIPGVNLVCLEKAL